MRAKDIPDGYWFKLERNSNVYFKLCAGVKGYHSLCVRLGSNKAWNMSNQSYAKLINQNIEKPRVRL